MNEAEKTIPYMGNKEAMIEALDTILDRLADHYPSSRPLKRPRGLELQYEEICSILKPCLVDQGKNVSLLLMGPRGSGKTQLIEACLQSIQVHRIRIVRLHGLVLKGDDVAVVVREIIRQLNDIAFAETKKDGDHKATNDLVRLRATSFTSSISLLDEILNFMNAEKIPICIVLEDFDAMIGSTPSMDKQLLKDEMTMSNRQLLLYHLLDRVSSSRGTSLCVIGTTTNVGAISLLEKRVKSRAEGASNVFYISPFKSFSDLMHILQNTTTTEVETPFSKQLQALLSTDENSAHDIVRLRKVMQRNYAISKDLRWFNRVLYYALSLYRMQIYLSNELPCLTDKLEEALVAQGASFHGIDEHCHNARIMLLKDLSGPQVALVLSARRILARDAEKEEIPKPLNLHRMLQEYQSYKGSADRFPEKILRAVFFQLLDMDLFRPSSDHSGGAPFQYEYSCSYYDMDTNTLLHLPLHLNLELDRELAEALKQDLLQCSTALKDWGKKKN